MRNPISAILHSADEILQSLNSISKSDDDSSSFDDIAQAANTILYCTNHQKRIVDDILTLSRLDANLLMISPSSVQPIHLVQNALRMFDAEVKAADVQLEMCIDPSLVDLNVDWVMLDPGRVLQILINLCSNAIKFTRSERERRVTVTVSASQRSPTELQSKIDYIPVRSKTGANSPDSVDWRDEESIYLSLTVKDTGRGLATEEKRRLFNRFAQGSPKTHTKYGGSGLGLFISRQLCEMQGGRIGLSSEMGKGSTFSFYIRTQPSLQSVKDTDQRTRAHRETFPTGKDLPKIHTVPRSSVQDKSSISPLAPKATENSEASVLHVLVVEDNLVNQTVVMKQLRRNGCIVHAANDGEEALAFLRTSIFWEDASAGATPLSIVLMDCEMPVMDGPTASRRIRDLEAHGKIRGRVPIIAVTANARDDQIKAMLGAGMDGVTTKPYRIPDLLVQIREVLERLSGQ